mmetsp:Transcript_91229/g.294892  ORF Transcript_91229/g.294892 Transcript_91229/m.294892 type:complete len:271 (+) Transcript_91229:376-1188(+)
MTRQQEQRQPVRLQLRLQQQQWQPEPKHLRQADPWRTCFSCPSCDPCSGCGSCCFHCSCCGCLFCFFDFGCGFSGFGCGFLCLGPGCHRASPGFCHGLLGSGSCLGGCGCGCASDCRPVGHGCDPSDRGCRPVSGRRALGCRRRRGLWSGDLSTAHPGSRLGRLFCPAGRLGDRRGDRCGCRRRRRRLLGRPPRTRTRPAGGRTPRTTAVPPGSQWCHYRRGRPRAACAGPDRPAAPGTRTVCLREDVPHLDQHATLLIASRPKRGHKEE